MTFEEAMTRWNAMHDGVAADLAYRLWCDRQPRGVDTNPEGWEMRRRAEYLRDLALAFNPHVGF